MTRCETTAQTLFERLKELEQSPAVEKFNKTALTQTRAKFPMSAALYQRTLCRFLDLETSQPSILPYPSHAILEPTTRSDNTHTQLRLLPRRRPTGQSRVPCRRLSLSRDELCSLDLSRLFNFTLQAMEISSVPLSDLNRYRSQRSVSHLGINRY